MVSESTNKLGAQEALRPYLGAKEAKAHRVLSQISLPTESILYKDGGREVPLSSQDQTRVNDDANKPNQVRGSHSSQYDCVDTQIRLIRAGASTPQRLARPSNHTCIIILQVHGTYFRLDAEPSSALISSQGVGNNKQTIAAPSHFHFCR